MSVNLTENVILCKECYPFSTDSIFLTVRFHRLTK